MNTETEKLINEKLLAASKLIDQAVTPLCEAASLAILERHFLRASNIIAKAQMAFHVFSEVQVQIIAPHDPKRPSP